MRNLASFIMRGRWQAALVAAVSALLSLLMPPTLVVSGAATALVALRRGGREGGLLTLLAGLGTAALAFPIFSVGAVGLAGALLLLFWLPVYLLALILRVTVSLAWSLKVAAAFGGLAVLAFYLFLGDPGAWWRDVLNELSPILKASGLVRDEAALNGVLEFLAPLMPGLLVSNLLAYILLSLLLGRWWQSLLFNPGGFREEFHALRLGQWSALVAAAVFGLALGVRWPLLVNLAFVLAVIYTLQGIALVHGIVGRVKLARGWLVGFYVLMIVALPQLLMLLCFLAVADAWADLRTRIKPRA